MVAFVFNLLRIYHLAHRKSHSNWSQSGTAMSMPLFHYVMPVTIFDPARGAKYGEEVIKMPTKRWDTLAWFQITLHCGDFEKSFNLGQIPGKFGVPSTGSSKAATGSNASDLRSAEATARKQAVKRPRQDDPTAGMPAALAEFMQLNATKANLSATILKDDKDESNAIIMTAIENRRAELAAFLKKD